MNIPFSRPDIGKDEIVAVSKVLKSGWLTMGEETKKFEKEFAEYVGAKHAVAVNSCTSALFLSLKALGIKEGDEVIVPSFTFASTVNVIIHCGATPVFSDITQDGYVMDQKSFEEVLTKKTKAVIPVHYAGNRATIKTKLPIIEDSAHLIQKKGNNNKVFTSCYSFYATKNMTTGEGGMITCNDDRLANWFREASLHGFSTNAWARYKLSSKGHYMVKFPGYKCNTTDLNSAIGRVQLKKLDTFEKKRKEVVTNYNELLNINNKGTHLYPILVKDKIRFLQYMRENGIGCSFHFRPLHLEKAYKKYVTRKLPITEYVGKRVVTLPLDAKITDREIKAVVKLVNNYYK